MLIIPLCFRFGFALYWLFALRPLLCHVLVFVQPTRSNTGERCFIRITQTEFVIVGYICLMCSCLKVVYLCFIFVTALLSFLVYRGVFPKSTLLSTVTGGLLVFGCVCFNLRLQRYTRLVLDYSEIRTGCAHLSRSCR